MTFRSDINGLRAIAVLSVLFYHFGVSGFGGGYVGVDVFFVISGFLMTQIIYTKLEKDKFSILGFYAARARRILPALAAVVAFLTVAGAFYLTPLDYKLFGRHALSALSFTSNIVFGHRGDYFDTISQVTWLLHTWSLSLEWQFYLLLPLFLAGLYKYKGGKFLKPCVISVFALSLIGAVALTPLYPVGAFFLLPARAWELLAGALVFFYGSRLSKIPYLAETGLAFIFAAVFFYSGDLNFPGHWAILPVAGAALLISAKKESRLLGNRAAQFFGTTSYSLYLWHWPAMVGAKYFDVPFTPLNVFLILGAVVLLSWASYVFIEEPFRHGKKKLSSPKIALGGYAALAALSHLIFVLGGIPQRVPADVWAAEGAKELVAAKHRRCSFDYKKDKGRPPDCLIGSESAVPSIAVWGDSHANSAAPALEKVLTKKKRSALLYSYAGCPPVLGAIFATKWKKYQCRDVNQSTYDKTISDPRIKDVLLVSRWPVYLMGWNEKIAPHLHIVFDDKTAIRDDNLKERSELLAKKMVDTMCALTAHGKNVYITTSAPEMVRNVSAALAKSRLLYRRDTEVNIPVKTYDERNVMISQALRKASKECHVHVLNVKPYICDATTCFGIRDGKPVYSDDNHLTEFGSDLIKPLFEKAFH